MSITGVMLDDINGGALGLLANGTTQTLPDALAQELINRGTFRRTSMAGAVLENLQVAFDPDTGVPSGIAARGSASAGSAAVAAALKEFVPLTANRTGIYNAMVAALAVGGCVSLPSGTYDLTDGGTNTTPLPVFSGVPVRCPQRPSFQWYPTGFIAPDSIPTAVLSGALLVGDGTFPAFAGNTTPLGSPPSSIPNAGFSGLHFENIVFKNVSTAIQIGATYNPGAWHSTFKNLYAIQTTSWGFNFENWQHITVENLFAWGCGHGQRWACSFNSANLAPGNSTFRHLYCVKPDTSTYHTRGIVFEAYGTSAELNELDIGYIQCNGGNSFLAPVVATMSSAGPDISVPDASVFQADDMVYFSVLNTNGFNKNQLGQSYFVISVNTVANTIQVSDLMRGTAITPTNAVSNSTQSIGSYGRPGIELVGLSGGYVKHFTLNQIDLETHSTGGILLQTAISGRLGLRNTPTIAANSCWAHIVARNGASFSVDSNYESLVIDAQTGCSVALLGCRRATPIQTDCGWGIVRDDQDSGRVGISLSEYANTDLVAKTPAAWGGDTIYWRSAQQYKVSQRGSGETDTAGSANYLTMTVSGGTRTLPLISSDTQVGVTLSMSNPFSVSCTWNSTTNAFGNKPAATALTIPAYGSATVQAQKVGATYFWAVINQNGATF